MLLENFSGSVDEKKVSLFTLNNRNGTRVNITNYGARVVEWLFNEVDVVVGFDSLDGYLNATDPYYGATIGRFANRIADGKFIIDGNEYQLPVNNPPNHLHGGRKGFHNCVWTVLASNDRTLQLEYISRDGEEGYPGNMAVTLTYSLTTEDELIIEYAAQSDQATIINLTNHSYFNLNGQGNGDILQHRLQINADHFTPIDESLIPVGQVMKVDNSPLDFRIEKTIGEDINQNVEQLQFANGFDHNYVLHTDPDVFAARAVGDKTGIVLEVYTTQPGMQFYSGNFMKGENGVKGGVKDEFRTAFCLETQHFPDSPNQPGFPSTVLLPDETFTSKTVYKLSKE